MKVLIACESSGAMRRAFQERGHIAYSCDILAADDNETVFHLQADIRNVLEAFADLFDLMIAHPPCQYLALSGIHWNHRIPGRKEKSAEALEFVRLLLDAPIPRIALENPVGIISTNIRKPDQYIQPWQFGHPESKKTGLWLKNLPALMPGEVMVPPALQANGKSPRWENQTATGQNKLGPSADRWKLRSATYPGVAAAMADQWGRLQEGK